jgi:hypothetical protein
MRQTDITINYSKQQQSDILMSGIYRLGACKSLNFYSNLFMQNCKKMQDPLGAPTVMRDFARF